MGKFYLANVGRAYFTINDSGTQKLVAYSESDTSTSFDASITKEELRGGPGNALLATTFHDSALALTYEDALFDPHLIAANVGDGTALLADLEATDGSACMETEEISIATAGEVTLTKTPLEAYGFYHTEDSAEWNIAPINKTTKKMTIPSTITTGKKVCCRYMAVAKGATINLAVDYVPSILHVTQFID